jgi:hypothetical protein
MLVALRLVEGPTVLSLAHLHPHGTPEVCAIHSAMDCILDVDMHVAVETSWGRVVFRLCEDDDLWMGLYPCVSIQRYAQRERSVLICAMGSMARHSVWNCLHMLHPDAWEVGDAHHVYSNSPSVLSVAVVVEHKHVVWSK